MICVEGKDVIDFSGIELYYFLFMFFFLLVCLCVVGFYWRR